MLIQDILRRKRNAEVLDADAIHTFMRGVADGSVGDAQVGAFAMAVVLNGMNRDEAIALTEATRDSGQVLRWHDLNLDGPVLDKHSTGGVGDLVSLVLGPWIAACGGHVPMISGRGLGHTGGTLDKLEAIPGYNVTPDDGLFRQLVKDAGVAIIGQTGTLAPADKRLYGVRDVTATVESLPLIVASILGKKLACGLDTLVMDVKVGNGAFMPTPEASRELAEAIVAIGSGAGTPTSVLLTDMNQPLANCAGNALEIHEALRLLRGDGRNKEVRGDGRNKEVRGGGRDSRLYQVTHALATEMLVQAGLATDAADAATRLETALVSGEALERFSRMVHGLGGPSDLAERTAHYLAPAPFTTDVVAPRAGTVNAIDTRALGLGVVELGGGRRNAGDAIDHRVGLSHIAALGQRIEIGQPLLRLHATSRAEADAVSRRLSEAFTLGEPAHAVPPELIHATLRQETSS
ncbi:thymidine phosphorylase [Chromohalobacter canadensis]|uniref:thymidine phosphorylase n=1 Tax=Chromohalobacter canadensis TaxID=141389 RepID=UPI0021C21C3F|nr:thymidine phosphorylase [Chromohalobacter canadensis]MCT8467300.1 thymidine phosphorylase [Chromohalobacter canadensis]MCT8470952.1 thymidine phosphorylase [Chromohalobacter canadensis]MCT8497797.1 thymidine phosphorylase [Chromohalobacter canadensis]